MYIVRGQGVSKIFMQNADTYVYILLCTVALIIIVIFIVDYDVVVVVVVVVEVPEEKEKVLLVSFALFALDVPVVLPCHLVLILLALLVVNILNNQFIDKLPTS